MSWMILKGDLAQDRVVLNRERERVALITVVGTDVQVVFPKASIFDWEWCYTSASEALTAGCAYVRGVERCLEIYKPGGSR